MTYTFYFFTSPKAPVHLPGAPYFIASALMLIGAILAVRSFKKHAAKTII
jgi:DHA1 family tetracycline resistance protein-like MFS transporter